MKGEKSVAAYLMLSACVQRTGRGKQRSCERKGNFSRLPPNKKNRSTALILYRSLVVERPYEQMENVSARFPTLV
jgi:hypothetical protein